LKTWEINPANIRTVLLGDFMTINSIVSFVVISAVSFFVQAKPVEDCTQILKNKFVGVTNVETVPNTFEGRDIAMNMLEAEGLLTGRALRKAQGAIHQAVQIYVVYSSQQGGSATDLVTTGSTCSEIRDVIRVQEE